MYGQSSAWYKAYQYLHNLSLMDLFRSFPFIPLSYSPPSPKSPNTLLNYLVSFRKTEEQLNPVIIHPIHIYSHSYNSFLLTKKQYKGVVIRNWKIKVHFWGISKGSDGERLDTHTRVQSNKMFTNLWME